MTRGRRVVYIYDEQVASCIDNIPHLCHRARVVHQLISSYGLTDAMICKPAQIADKDVLLKFHSLEYVDFLMKTSRSGHSSPSPPHNNWDDQDNMDNDGGNANPEEYGLGYDCPVFANLAEFALRIAGSTITAAKCIVEEGAQVAINWNGGWHHAQRSEASGFCYVNDIVLGIHQLQTRFQRVLYIDLDAHHGDGVENAFEYTDKVMTLSFHHFSPGYFPGSGDLKDVGKGRGRYCAVNVPLKAGLTDEQLTSLFDVIFERVVKVFQPEVFVVQCGADCLARDPLGAFNLTQTSVCHAVGKILTVKTIPTLLLGGGGYNIANAARLWTCLTAEVLNVDLCKDIPEDNQYFLKYGPDFELEIQQGLRKNENDAEFVSNTLKIIMRNLDCLDERMRTASAVSVPIQTT